MKPENVLVDEKGYMVITDFGLAKILEQEETTDTFCGTPEYMAPEIQNDVGGYGFECDWWSLGILCYEMIVGFAPFYAKKNQHPDEVFKIIREKRIVFPDAKKHGIPMTEECKDFIRKLLAKKPEDRLGSKNDI